jgi:hypothetical protein
MALVWYPAGRVDKHATSVMLCALMAMLCRVEQSKV